MKSRLLSAIALLALLASCGSDPAPESEGTLAGTERAHFRGSTLGDMLDDVLRREPVDSIVFSIPGQVVYDMAMGSYLLQVRYEFEQEVLVSIQADVFSPDAELLSGIQETLRARFDRLYARGEGQGDFEVWLHPMQDGTVAEITLADESLPNRRQLLSLTIYLASEPVAHSKEM